MLRTVLIHAALIFLGGAYLDQGRPVVGLVVLGVTVVSAIIHMIRKARS